MGRGNASGRVCLSVLFVFYFLTDDLETSFWYTGTSSVKFIYQGHWVKVKVTSAKRANERNQIHTFAGGLQSTETNLLINSVNKYIS